MMFPVAKILEKKLCQSVQAPDDLEFHKQSGFDTNYIMGVRTYILLGIKGTCAVPKPRPTRFCVWEEEKGRRRMGRRREGGSLDM